MGPIAAWRGYVLMGAVSGFVATAASLAVVYLIAPTLGGPVGSPSGTVIEEDAAAVPFTGDSKKGEVVVFYRRPFTSPPKLTFPEGIHHGCFLVEQRADSFKLGRDQTSATAWQNPAEVKWRAEGVLAR